MLRIAGATAGLAGLCLVASAAAAAPVGRSLARAFGNTDLAAIRPVVEAALDEGAVGAARPWHAANGDTGNVHLLSGGGKAPGACGRVRITAVKAGAESGGYRFRYCRDAAGRWRTAG